MTDNRLHLVLASYVLGIIAEYHLRLEPGPALAAAVSSAAIALGVHLNRLGRTLTSIPLLALCFLLTIMGMGLASTSWALFRPLDSIMTFAGKRVELQGTVSVFPEQRVDRQYVVLDHLVAECDGRRQRLSGKIRLTIDDPNLDVRPGARMGVVCSLKIPDAAGNPGEFCYQGYLLRQGVVLTGFVSSEDLLYLGEARFGFLTAAWNLRTRLVDYWKGWLGPHAGMGVALLLGLRAEVSTETSQDFTEAGVSHLLAVSGLHVGIVWAFCAWLFRFLGLGTRGISGATLISLLFYGTMAGWSVSVRRAVVMAGSLCISRMWGRPGNSIGALSLAALFTLVWSPLSLFDAGFQLSFAITLAILIGVGKVYGRLRHPFAAMVYVSLVAQAAAAPLVAYHFGTVHLWALPASLVMTPLVWLLLFTLLLLTPLSMITFLSGILALPVKWESQLVMELASTFSGLWGAEVHVPKPSALFVIGIYGAVFLIRWSRCGIWHKELLVFRPGLVRLGIVLAGCGWFTFTALGLNRAPLEVVFLDVGKGDCVFLTTRGGVSILVDGGGGGDPTDKYYFDVGERILVPYLRSRGVSHLDVVVLTHPHADHYQGLIAVLKEFPVGVVVLNGEIPTDYGYRGFLEALLQHKTVVLKEGQRFQVGELLFHILNPPLQAVSLSMNDRSLVTRIVFRGFPILLTGDIEVPAQVRLSSSPFIRARLLKLPHHGSDSTTFIPFVRNVQAEAAVAAGGPREPKWSNSAVAREMANCGVDVFSTGSSGAVIVRTDGKRLIIRTVRRPFPFVKWWEQKVGLTAMENP